MSPVIGCSDCGQLPVTPASHRCPSTIAADRDGSERPEDRVQPEPVWGDVRHHQERIEQLKGWVRDWKARAVKAEAAEAALAEERATRARVEALRDEWLTPVVQPLNSWQAGSLLDAALSEPDATGGDRA